MGLKISVVMAAYNGAKYIKNQVSSILPQIGVDGELIIVEDCSTDETLELLSEFDDSRIHIYKNLTNQGVRRSFERAISLASGEIIFLSDQDDVWKINKVFKCLEVFQKFPKVTLVVSDANIIDANGERVLESHFFRRGGFKAGVLANIFKNRYLGCVMCFRRSLLKKILPFPESIPQHDMWIGIVNQIYGRCFYIDLPLHEYRLHENNASSAASNRRGNFIQMFLWRYGLIKALIFGIFLKKGRT